MTQAIERRTYTILIVDDDTGVRRTVGRILSGEGHDVVEASDGVAALRLMHSTVFDLVVTDIVMPGMEGLEFLRILHARPDRPKVIAMSGGGRGSATSYLELARTFGADATLAKPITKTELVSSIDRVMTES